MTGGRVERVAYALSTWDSASRRFEVEGHPVRLEGFTYQDKNIIHVTGSNRGRISLLVVPAGRARNERPRDRLGRPLSRGLPFFPEPVPARPGRGGNGDAGVPGRPCQ
jgi:hypothetical protein